MRIPAGISWCVFAMLLAVVGGCTRLPPVDRAVLKPGTSAELQQQLLEHEPLIDLFRSSGPFAVTVQQNRRLQLAPKESVDSDLYLSNAPEGAPLAIFLHGHDSTKGAHARQAFYLASWGVHGLVLQLPNKGPWDANGRTLSRIARLIHSSPQILDSRIDVNKIILIGYSFGASAVAVALAQGAPAAGGILLDPAAIGKDLPDQLRRIDKPVMVIGSDDEVNSPRNREYFFDFIRGGVAEVSIRGATHEDAQYPSDSALQNPGMDPNTTDGLQMSFVSALISAALSLSATGAFDYAWASFAPAFDAGHLFNAKKK